MTLANEKYVAFTTYKKDGSEKTVPVWIVDASEGKLAFTTYSSSWKIKRLANNPAVQLQPSNAKGEPREGSTVTDGTAEVVQGAEFERVRDLVKGKYGYQFTLATLAGKFMKLIGRGSGTDRGVIITLT